MVPTSDTCGNPDLMQEVLRGEILDTEVEERYQHLHQIQGSLEALTAAGQADDDTATDATDDPDLVQLNDHQQAMVDSFRAVQKQHKGEVYAVADQAALEGFGAMAAGLFRKTVFAFAKTAPDNYRHTAKALKHYVGLAQLLRERLLKLRPLLEKREFPWVDVFDYGSYARFFMCQGVSMDTFTGFADSMAVQNTAMRHVYAQAENYAPQVAEKLLDALQGLQANGQTDIAQLQNMRDAIAFRWELAWKDADLNPFHGQTPQAALNAFPERKFVSLVPLLDNRYLVAHSPKKDGGQDPEKIIEALKAYGASLVFDTKAPRPDTTSMNVPNIDELLTMLDETVVMLSDMRTFEAMAKKNESFAKDLEKALDILAKKAQEKADPAYWGFVGSYFKVAGAISSAIQQPYTAMAWMYIRCAMVVTSLAEHAALESPKDRQVSVRFFASQHTEFSNPALESYGLTRKALEAAARAAS